uniref:(northern house mosquito) hypothetical protein n=1 Tax=Culex pipiens TaxID=7175 RepID=A0A8D8AK20_CULPI
MMMNVCRYLVEPGLNWCWRSPGEAGTFSQSAMGSGLINRRFASRKSQSEFKMILLFESRCHASPTPSSEKSRLVPILVRVFPNKQLSSGSLVFYLRSCIVMFRFRTEDLHGLRSRRVIEFVSI